jgi:hypothetical protein
MTPERMKLWHTYQAREAAGALPGQSDKSAATPISGSLAQASPWRSPVWRSGTSALSERSIPSLMILRTSRGSTGRLRGCQCCWMID